MRQIFSHKMAGNEDIDSLVRAFEALVDANMQDKNGTDEYKENNKTFNEAMIKYCVENANMEFTGLDMIKDPMTTVKGSFKDTFTTVISEIITPIVPKVVSERYATLYDVAQVGFGDNAKYEVESNELFIVTEAAEGIARGGVQTLYNNEYSVSATKKEITVGVDWYRVAAGKQDWGVFGFKVAKSFANYINASAIRAMTSVISDATKRAEHGIAGYYANGFSDANWLTLEKNVKLTNNGSQVYALSTNIGLAQVLPDSTKGFRFNEDASIVKNGFLPDYKKVPLLEIDNALYPNTINGNPVSLVSDDYIYFIAMGAHKPVKVVFEGNTVTVTPDPLSRADETFQMTVSMRLGVDVVVGSKFGTLFVG